MEKEKFLKLYQARLVAVETLPCTRLSVRVRVGHWALSEM